MPQNHSEGVCLLVQRKSNSLSVLEILLSKTNSTVKAGSLTLGGGGNDGLEDDLSDACAAKVEHTGEQFSLSRGIFVDCTGHRLWK